MADTVRSGMISGLLPPPLEPADVHFEPADDRYRIRLAGDDRTYYLPADAPPFQLWALRYARNTIRPVYVEATGDVIETVRLPLVGRIRRLVRDANGNTRAALDSSAPWLRVPDGPGGEILSGVLGAALRSGGIIMVTTADDHNVIQAVAAPVDAWYLAPRFVLQASHTVDDIPASVVPMARIEEAFAIVKEHRCGVAASASCVPFDFPDTGCEARAQEMCRILAGEQLIAGKVWVFDDDAHQMGIATHNFQQACRINWSFHVAVYLRLDAAEGADGVFVLDPSLFDGPKPLRDFLTALTVQTPHLFSDAEAYNAFTDGLCAPAPSGEPEATLDKCRTCAAARHPQPPYCTDQPAP